MALAFTPDLEAARRRSEAIDLQGVQNVDPAPSVESGDVPEEEDDVDELEGEDWGDKAGIDGEVTGGITKLGG